MQVLHKDSLPLGGFAGLKDGDLLRGTNFNFTASSEKAQVILITLKDSK